MEMHCFSVLLSQVLAAWISFFFKADVTFTIAATIFTLSYKRMYIRPIFTAKCSYMFTI